MELEMPQEHIFKKNLHCFHVDEAALLVGMLKGPGQYDPNRHPVAALDRRNVVIDQMLKNDMIKEGEASIFKEKSTGY